MLLVACGAGCSGHAPSPRDGDALVVLLPQEPDQIDPRFVADAYGLKISRLVFASLMTIDPRTLEIVPDLAERIENETPERWRVTLRPGLRFSDGSTLDSADVAATFRSLVDPRMQSRFARTFEHISRIETPDARTIIFTLDGPHATFATDIEVPILRAEDEHRRIAAMDGPEPIGAGPYRLIERRTGMVRLAANPHWHGGEVRHPDLRLIVVHDDNTRTLRMLAGAADVAINAVPPLLVPLCDEEESLHIASAVGVGTTYLGVHNDAAHLRDLRVRRALAHAIDRPSLIRAKLSGRAELASTWIPPGHWARVEGIASYGYDPARARVLLDEAGLRDPDGDGPAPRARFVLRTSSDRSRVSIARAIGAMLREVGIAVDVRPSETATLLADLAKGRFELTLMQVPEVFEPHVLNFFFASDKIPGAGREGSNRWRYRNARFDAVLERGRTTIPRDERRAIYAEAQRMLAEDLPVIPLWHEHVVAITSRRASGIDAPRDGRFAVFAR